MISGKRVEVYDEQADQIRGQSLTEKYLVRREACYCCLSACGHYSNNETSYTSRVARLCTSQGTNVDKKEFSDMLSNIAHAIS